MASRELSHTASALQGGHTPGPWAVVQAADDYDNISICAFDGDPADGIMADVIAEIISIDDEADARLIAAAPELLAALKEADALFPLALGSVSSDADNRERCIAEAKQILAQIRTTIAKAEGRS